MRRFPRSPFRPGRRQRGILDFGFGSSDTETSGTRREEGTRTRTTDQRAERQTDTTGRQEQEQVTTQLPQEVQDLLVGLIERAAGGTGEGGEPGVADTATGAEIAQLARDMAERARQGQAEIDDAITAIVAQRDTEGRRQIGQLQTRLAQQVGGSTANAGVFQATARAEGELQGELAAAEGQLRLAGRQITTEELTNAIAGLGAAPAAGGAQSNAVVQLVDALRGATTTQRGTLTSEQRTEDLLTSTERLTEIIDMLVTSQSTSETDSSSFGFGF